MLGIFFLMRWLSRGLGVEIKTEKMESIRGSCVGPTYYDEWILNNAEEKFKKFKITQMTNY